MGNFYIFLTAVLWSTSGVLIKFINGSAIAINALRSLIAFLFLAVSQKSWHIRLGKTIVAAALCLTFTNLFYVMAVKLTSAANAITLQYLAPLFVLIWDSIYQRRLPGFQKLICIAVAFGGMVLFFYDSLGKGYLLGNLLAVAAGLCFSGVFFLNSLPNSSAADASKLAFLLSFVIGLPYIGQFAYGEPDSVWALLFLGIFQVGLAYHLYAKGCQLTSPLNASLISLLEIVLNTLCVYLFFKETISPLSLLGAVVIVAAVVANAVLERK